MNLWESVDLSSTIRSYEYTKYTKYQIYKTVDSRDFREMDSKTIFEFISSRMEIVPFNHYLRRFLYRRCAMEEGVENVDDAVFLDVLYNSFVENAAPYSFHPTTKKMRRTMKDWLKVENVKRTTIFILGFGLGMDDSEVDEFLTKVNKEESFDFGNPEETIYWFCYHNHHRYSKAKELLSYYEEAEPAQQKNQSLWDAMKHDPKMYVHSEKELRIFLKYLKTFRGQEDPAYHEFDLLYGKVRDLIAQSRNESAFIDGSGETFTIDDISPGDVEKVIYTEVPTLSKGNLMKMSASILSKQFMNKRMGRGHIANVLKKKELPERYDLITLLFFVYAHSVYYTDETGQEEDEAVARFRDYMDEINDILKRCNMAGIYPVNPYEAFILMCLVTEDPLGAFYDVWKMSYGG